jgi:nicotinate-nucleotide adenylyltransferase
VNIALFGGTFDPIHSGHLRAAKAAARKLKLDQVLFIPSGRPPHKTIDNLTAFAHRYAMVALACAAESRFIPSLLESPRADGRPQFSISTARAVRRTLGRKDHLFFLIGVDALLDLRHWRDYRGLLDLVNFIVVTRPGSDAGKIKQVLPADMVSPDYGGLGNAGDRVPVESRREPGTIQLPKTTLYVLSGVHVSVASRDIRRAMATGRHVTRLVPPAVEEYILKQGLYRK